MSRLLAQPGRLIYFRFFFFVKTAQFYYGSPTKHKENREHSFAEITTLNLKCLRCNR